MSWQTLHRANAKQIYRGVSWFTEGWKEGFCVCLGILGIIKDLTEWRTDELSHCAFTKTETAERHGNRTMNQESRLTKLASFTGFKYIWKFAKSQMWDLALLWVGLWSPVAWSQKKEAPNTCFHLKLPGNVPASWSGRCFCRSVTNHKWHHYSVGRHDSLSKLSTASCVPTHAAIAKSFSG